ncbi:hypothetical protein GW813_13535, partial [bacterium]|nr:hypothetical protein [bacterium]
MALEPLEPVEVVVVDCWRTHDNMSNFRQLRLAWRSASRAQVGEEANRGHVWLAKLAVVEYTRGSHSARRRAISTRVFVGNMSFRTTEEELVELLSAAGQIVNVYLPSDR